MRIYRVICILCLVILIHIPVNELEGVAFTKHFDFTVQGWDSIKAYKIGFRRGTKFVKKNIQGMSAYGFLSNKQLFMVLEADRIDLAKTIRSEGLEQISQLNMKNIKALQPPLVKLKLYHYLHIKNEGLAERITQSLKAMDEKGDIQRIREQMLSLLKIG